MKLNKQKGGGTELFVRGNLITESGHPEKSKNKITVSAPGKLMLFGEHAVVYGYPCIVTAIGQRMQATVELTDDSMFHLNAPDVEVTNYKKPMNQLGKGDPSTSLGTSPKGAKFVELALYNYYKSYKRYINGVRIATKSEFNSQFGFGSSSASTVCVIKALSELTHQNLTNKQLFDLSYKTVLDIQGKGSGFDVAAAIYGGTLYFVTGGKIIKPLKLKSLPLIVGYSGIKADTVTLVNQVAKKLNNYPKIIDNIFLHVQQIVIMAKEKLLKKDFQAVGQLMDFNQGYLSSLGVSSGKLESMIHAARNAGAYGAKLSGAGVGDCMIALAPPNKVSAVKKAITEAGGQVINIKANVEGVKIEK